MSQPLPSMLPSKLFLKEFFWYCLFPCLAIVQFKSIRAVGGLENASTGAMGMHIIVQGTGD